MEPNNLPVQQQAPAQPAVIYREKKNVPDDTIDLYELFFTILEKWVFILIAAIIGAVVAFGFYKLTVTPSYKAAAEIFITRKDSVIDISELSISDRMSVDYQKFFKSRTVLKKTIKKLDLDMDYTQLSKLISIENPANSHILDIYVTTKDPDSALLICNCLLENGLDEILRITGSNQPSVIDYSEPDAVTMIKPSLIKYVFMGAVIGAMLVCGWVTLLFVTDTSLKTEEDIEKHLGLSVLAFVPDFNKDGKDSDSKEKRRRLD